MKIVVISDTHMPKRGKKLPTSLIEDLQSAQLIIHAGDWQTLDVYQELLTYAPVEGVSGNVDGEDIKERFGEKRILQINGKRIGVVHGHGEKGTTEKRAIAAFAEEDVDLIIFGHSHIPVKKQSDGVMLFNPGSPTDKRRQPAYSYGVITIQGTIHVDHVFYNSKE
ncbi:metallophosphoesterase [Peribacillus cavernae]|uniref:Phosphoesterase n=1 Tax=Peribacillus cavernae TaxID=1674310 RepID=A0A3S0VL79_9BACI|nr:metallophosphoesterase [Peribacillus cavernae]MDQ0220452.1 putative phosphoesterase [Peribacillus cavernae]RUQ28044.1 metallophosphoesterase [Peribacillus cavernae]